MSFEQASLRGGLLTILLISAAQDIRRREVSNLITIPLFFLGIFGILLSANLVLAAIALSFVAVAMMPGGYGAADAKILVGLAGLWPESVPASLLAMLVFDLYWRRLRPGGLAPLVVAILVGVALTMVGDAWAGG
jgi:Flp pilus assembly protein protease CpaA